MNWEKFQRLHLYLRFLNDRLNRLETGLENSSGHDNKAWQESGSDLTTRSWLRRKRNTLIRRTSGHNTITTRTTRLLPRFKEKYFNITTKTSSPEETDDGLLGAKGSMYSPQSTSPTHSENDRITHRL